MPRAVILTALPVEYLAVREHLKKPQKKKYSQGMLCERGEFTNWDVSIVEIGKGNANAAAETERAINYFRPDVLFFVGIAGGIKEDVRIGDVVATTKVYEYEASKVGTQLATRPDVYNSTKAVVQWASSEAREGEWIRRIHNYNENCNPQAFIDPLASGEKVVASRDSELFQFLRSSYNDAIAVDMESFGFLKAAFAYPEIQTIVIRGISDLIQDKNADDPIEGSEEERQERASRHASAFAFQILAKINVRRRQSLLASVLWGAGICALLIMGPRWLGILQAIELAAYDHFMKLPPYEKVDERIAIVGVQRSELPELYTSNDFTKEISDLKLTEILAYLLTLKNDIDKHAIIGVDVIRDKPHPEPESNGALQGEHYSQLKSLITKQGKQVISTCRRFGEDKTAVGAEVISNEVGFHDLIRDTRQGNTPSVRRQFLKVESSPELAGSSSALGCDIEESFSYKMALRFLSETKTLTKSQEENWNKALIDDYGRIKIKNTTFEPVWPRTGGFQGISAGGYQILLNYRNPGINNNQAFNTVNATNILKCPAENKGCGLDDKERKSLENASIILIGYMGKESRDEHVTPIGSLHGVEVHAHMISYILGTVISDKYSIARLRVLPALIEAISIVVAGLSGGLIVWVCSNYNYSWFRIPNSTAAIAIAVPSIVVVAFGVSWIAFSFGLWLPFASLSLGFSCSSLGVVLVKKVLKKW
ncbi:CHASE2 domain-containing protein [Leptothoe kymatousa]|uniref:CHASE2 domain-containing protein n=1 Tax=Leptothoe kymatousa TAU-MAC 1615 TaxID=2364775 RepID=A0ABS5Y7E8_9CYAN|nr:CHASE2 domain-containing protein [Leptothoe kymatousa]MBT9313785.1 CHASE2 domain-containing protein [Leptothoe kymatousa TAU-MAC 1615]